jgi:hypothetical protein
MSSRFSKSADFYGFLEYGSAKICIRKGNGASAGPLHVFTE